MMIIWGNWQIIIITIIITIILNIARTHQRRTAYEEADRPYRDDHRVHTARSSLRLEFLIETFGASIL